MLYCLLLLAQLTTAPATQPTRELVIVHFGDSTTTTLYLPKDQHIERLLKDKLSAAFPSLSIISHNVARDGEFVRQFLDGGRYEQMRQRIEHIDIALIRYGQNDWKRFKPEEFQAHLTELCQRLEKDYPRIRIVLETNTYKDLAHGGDKWMNDHWNKYWEITRQVAKERNYPLVDIAERLKREIEAGKWDFFIRNQEMSKKQFGQLIIDDSKDKEMQGAQNWFYDGHPNLRGLELVAEEEFKVLSSGLTDALQPASRPATTP